MRQTTLCSLLILLPLLAGCYGGDEGRYAPPPQEESAAGGEQEATPSPPMAGAGSAPSSAAGGLDFELPESWQPETPASSMRIAQASIPGEAGPAELAVFYFGAGGGGGVEANLDRWIGQMEVKSGTEPHRESFEAGDFRVTWLEVEGTLKPSTMGMGPSSPQPDSTMLAAVVEGPGGPWFFKATGPTATLTSERDAFLEMLQSVGSG